MNIFVIGSGGREHALVWKLQQSSRVKKIYCAPGNGGIAQLAECVDIKADDIKGLIDFAKNKKIDLTVVGPEAPLVAGIVDIFEQEGLKIFGPRKVAAQLEGSKVFAKEFMHRNNIPTATFMSCENVNEARALLKQTQFPVVVKADGLAAGKGVFVCSTLQEGEEALQQIENMEMLKKEGKRIVIEECLAGEEASILAISDGKKFVMLEASQDHKRIFDDDLGPNTGGMGAYSPAPVITDLMAAKIELQIIEPTIRGMLLEDRPFKGVLYAGLMITDEGPKVLEYNVRFGDPETQAVLPRLKSDLLEILLASCDERLEDFDLEWDTRSCVCVVMSSGGYPGKYKKGLEILGLKDITGPDSMVFHAGTKKEGRKILTSGGRVLGVTSLENSLEEAIKKVYEAVEIIKFESCFFRRDIGARALKKVMLTQGHKDMRV